jgi:FAD/FMN-containing dehydrogenase
MKSLIVNFGRDVQFRPQCYVAPRSESELLDAIDQSTGKVRAVGSRHAWNEGIKTEDTLIDMRHLDHVRVVDRSGQKHVIVGAGCTVKKLLMELNRVGLTLPSVGLITEQTIAGATATGTHGSGKHSLSHYVQSAKIACKPTIRAEIRIVDSGEELRAARCSLGCLGVVVEVTLPVVQQYYVEESAIRCPNIKDVLALESETPLQQSFLMPHTWDFFCQRRRVAEDNSRSGYASLYRIYWYLGLDWMFHLLMKLFVLILRSRWLTRFYFQHIVPHTIMTNWIVVDRSDRMLVTEHELFRHVEIEIFVRRSKLESATSYVIDILQAADRSEHELNANWCSEIDSHAMSQQFQAIRGTFTHHYPICFRRVLPDDTMISMSSGTHEDWFAISFISYLNPRDDFFRLAEFLAQSMFRLFEARIHWGKRFPLHHSVVKQQYPELKSFRDLCRQFDPKGVFRNAFVNKTIGFDDDNQN